MEPLWGWIVVYALGLTILQLLLYRYLVGGGEGISEGSRGLGDEGREVNVDGPDRSAEVQFDPLAPRSDVSRWTVEDGMRVCPHCGAKNEPEQSFRRCWNCVGRL
jgi:hypothetical protein